MQISLSSRHPNSVFVISAPAGLGRANRSLEPKLTNWPAGTIAAIKDTWIGQLPGPGRRMIAAPSGSSAQSSSPPSASGPPPVKKQDMFDFLLYFGGIESVVYGEANPDLYQDDTLWEELNRRSKVRFNHELISETRKTGILRPIAYR